MPGNFHVSSVLWLQWKSGTVLQTPGHPLPQEFAKEKGRYTVVFAPLE